MRNKLIWLLIFILFLSRVSIAGDSESYKVEKFSIKLEEHLKNTIPAGDKPSKHYDDTSGLRGDDKFQDFIYDYFGKRKSNYLYENGLLSRQMIGVLNGWPIEQILDDVVYIEKELVFASGCRIHSCMEKGAFVLNTESMDAIFGMIHYIDEKNKDFDDPLLSCFYKNEEFRDKYYHLIVQWAKHHYENINNIRFIKIEKGIKTSMKIEKISP